MELAPTIPLVDPLGAKLLVDTDVDIRLELDTAIVEATETENE